MMTYDNQPMRRVGGQDIDRIEYREIGLAVDRRGEYLRSGSEDGAGDIADCDQKVLSAIHAIDSHTNGRFPNPGPLPAPTPIGLSSRLSILQINGLTCLHVFKLSLGRNYAFAPDQDPFEIHVLGRETGHLDQIFSDCCFYYEKDGQVQRVVPRDGHLVPSNVVWGAFVAYGDEVNRRMPNPRTPIFSFEINVIDKRTQRPPSIRNTGTIVTGTHPPAWPGHNDLY